MPTFANHYGMLFVSDFSALSLTIAAWLDYWIGDPWNWLHPVQVIGWGIDAYTRFVFKRFTSPALLRIAGVGLAIGTIGITALSAWAIVAVASEIDLWLGLAVHSILLASCFAARSLRRAATEVLKPLQAGDLNAARSQLSRYVGRDTENLTDREILRALLETVTENATDGMMAPLFWAIVGAFTPLGSAPVSLAYKAASTLDSMVGYREAPYTDLGWCSARTEDYLTWIPCRLTVFSLAILSGKPQHVWTLCNRDAPQDPSPNAGWSECAYAAVLGVQVGGTNQYQGITKHKPLLGDPLRPITPDVIHQALALTRINVFVWLAIGLIWLILL